MHNAYCCIFVLTASQALAADKVEKGTGKSLGAMDDYRAIRFETRVESVDSGIKDKSTNKVGQSATWYWREVTYSVTGINGNGTQVYRFYHKVYWEYDGTYVANIRRSSWPQVLYFGWEYVGLTGNTGYYASGNTRYYSFYQGHFRLGVNGYWVQHTYPWIEVNVYGSGNYSGNGIAM